MTAATVSERHKEHLAEENVKLEFTSGETFTTSLGDIKSIGWAWGEAVGTAVPEFTISGRTATITTPGITVTDKILYLTIKGRL